MQPKTKSKILGIISGIIIGSIALIISNKVSLFFLVITINIFTRQSDPRYIGVYNDMVSIAGVLGLIGGIYAFRVVYKYFQSHQ